MMRTYIVDKEHARLFALEQQLRAFCRANHGMVWLSARTLTQHKLFRGSSETLRLARQLAAGGHLGRAVARGRGRGRGRTLYWLPSTKKWLVLQELRREDMPHSAIVQAVGFFARKERLASKENVTDGERQRSLGLSTFGTDREKGMPAKPAQRSRAPNGPPSQPVIAPSTDPSAPPSTRRLSGEVWAAARRRLVDQQLEAALARMARKVRDP